MFLINKHLNNTADVGSWYHENNVKLNLHHNEKYFLKVKYLV